MATPAELMLQELLDRYVDVEIGSTVGSLYDLADETERVFAALHDQLNDLLDFLNTKARGNGHYNANESRQLLKIIEDIDEIGQIFDVTGDGISLDERYATVLETCSGFLEYTHGSPIPEGFRATIIKYEPVFFRGEKKVRVQNRPDVFDLKMVGSGSYANVYRYLDTEYNETFALKRAKKECGPGDLTRFRQEFEVMKSVRSPYIVQVYRFDDHKNQYTMEYCDATLREYVERENSALGFATRKRMALQFLYGLRHLHAHKHLHRDVSYQNVLVKRYDGHVVVLKLSDFGFLKRDQSDLTRTESELRRTILDPTLEHFRDYAMPNEIYCIGFVLSFIFSGRKKIGA